MKAKATTVISILRGDAPPDDYLDVEPSDVAVYTGIPASLIERTRHVFTADAPEPLIVRYITCRVGAEHDIRTNDRILDEWTGYIYAVDSYMSPQNPAIAADISISLKRVT